MGSTARRILSAPPRAARSDWRAASVDGSAAARDQAGEWPPAVVCVDGRAALRLAAVGCDTWRGEKISHATWDLVVVAGIVRPASSLHATAAAGLPVDAHGEVALCCGRMDAKAHARYEAAGNEPEPEVKGWHRVNPAAASAKKRRDRGAIQPCRASIVRQGFAGRGGMRIQKFLQNFATDESSSGMAFSYLALFTSDETSTTGDFGWKYMATRHVHLRAARAPSTARFRHRAPASAAPAPTPVAAGDVTIMAFLKAGAGRRSQMTASRHKSIRR